MQVSTAGRLLALALGGYGLLCLLVVLAQRRLLYFPARATGPDALAAARGLGLEAWRDGRGALLGWRAPGAGKGLRVLVFHGNAGSALDRGYYLDLLGGPDTEVILFEYPGYGSREGAPSEDSLVVAGVEAVARLRAEAPGPLWLLGESLGSGVASAVAARRPGDLAGLVLVTPFARLTEVAAWHYPWLPMGLLLRDRWDNAAALARYPGPVGLLVAGRDEVVGAAQGRLLAAALGPRARLWEVPEAGHNTLPLRPGAPPWPGIRGFLRP